MMLGMKPYLWAVSVKAEDGRWYLNKNSVYYNRKDARREQKKIRYVAPHLPVRVDKMIRFEDYQRVAKRYSDLVNSF